MNLGSPGAPPAASRRIWRPTCCVLTSEDDGGRRRMRNLFLALATLAGVLMVAVTATHTF